MSRMRKVYLYVVSFVALMMAITGTVSVFSSLSDILIPVAYTSEFRVAEILPQENNEDYESRVEKARAIHEEENKLNEEREVKYAKRRLLTSLSPVLVGSIVYAYHWKKIEKEK